MGFEHTFSNDFGSVLGFGSAFQVDSTTTPNVTYLGWAQAGALTSEPRWAICTIDTTVGVIKLWADGNTQFDNVWDDHATTVVYS